MTRIEWWTREYICSNGVCEKTKFPVQVDGEQSARTGRNYKRGIRRWEKNANEAKHEAARTANNNFRAGRDHLLTVTVSEEGYDELVLRAGTNDSDVLLMQLRKEIANWIRRAKRLMKKSGEDQLKYIAFPSYRDGKTMQPVQLHAHVLVNAEAVEAMAASWKLGFVFGTDKKLYSKHHGDLTDLVEYLMDQTRQVGTEKRYIPSRNLDKPKANRPRPVKNPDARLRVPKGASLIFYSEQRAGRPQKIRYYRPEEDQGRADQHVPDESCLQRGGSGSE